MNMAELYKAKRIEGLHNEDHSFPFAALAASLSPRDRDHFSHHVLRNPLWSETGRQVARGIAGRRIELP